MKNTNEELISRLLEGQCSEIEIELLIKKIKNNEIDNKELSQQLKMHGILSNRLHADKEGSQIFKVINSLNQAKNDSISSRIMKTLPAKPKSKNNYKMFLLGIAAIFFVSFIAWEMAHNNFANSIQNEKGNLKILIGNELVKSIPIIEKTDYQIHNNENGQFQSNEGVKLNLYANTNFQMVGNQISLQKGKILAEIAKRKPKEQLEFLTGDAKTIITGTKFCLNYLERNHKMDYLLQLFEGTIEFEKDGKKTKISANQYLFLSDLDNKLIQGELTETSDKVFDNNIVHISPAKYNWIPFFWEKWTAENVKISDTKKEIVLISKPNEIVRLTSQVVKTLKKGLDYEAIVSPGQLHGKVEIGMKCYYEGKFMYQDSFEIEPINNQFQTISKEVRLGVLKIGEPKMFSLQNISKLTFKGKISHFYTIVHSLKEGEMKPKNSDHYIEDVEFELYIKSENNSAGSLSLNSFKITR